MGRRVQDSVGTRGPESSSRVSCLESGQDGFRMGVWVLPGGRGGAGARAEARFGDAVGRSSSAWPACPGPTRKMPPSASAMDFFQLFVPDNVLKNMVVQTNLYAKKFQERFGSDGAWADVTLPEMKAFLGYVISTSTSHCESVLSIWSGGFYSNRSLALVMSQARFEKILKYFHVVAFRSSQTTHGLYKVQPFLDSLQSGFDSAFRPSQTQVRPWAPGRASLRPACTPRSLPGHSAQPQPIPPPSDQGKVEGERPQTTLSALLREGFPPLFSFFSVNYPFFLSCGLLGVMFISLYSPSTVLTCWW